MPYEPSGRPNGRPRKIIPPDDGSKPNLPAFLWRALAVEAEHFAGGREPWPSTARAQKVADEAGVSRRAIEKRRRDDPDPLYRRGLLWLIRERWIAKLSAKLGAADEEPAADGFAGWEVLWRGERQKWRREYMLRWARRNWPKKAPAAVRSQFDGKVYSDVEAYAEHLLANGFMPWPNNMRTRSRGFGSQ